MKEEFVCWYEGWILSLVDGFVMCTACFSFRMLLNHFVNTWDSLSTVSKSSTAVKLQNCCFSSLIARTCTAWSVESVHSHGEVSLTRLLGLVSLPFSHLFQTTHIHTTDQNINHDSFAMYTGDVSSVLNEGTETMAAIPIKYCFSLSCKSVRQSRKEKRSSSRLQFCSETI